MKTKTTIVLTLISFSVWAGEICIITTPEDDPRIAEAFGSILGLKDASGKPRNATAAEIQGATAQWIGNQTHDYERRQNMATFTPPPFTSGSLKGGTTTPSATPKKKK